MRRAGTHLRALAPLLLAAVAGGCAGVAGAKYEGTTGTGGGSGSECHTIACVRPITNTLTFAAEITPPIGSGAALTEIATAQASGGNPVGLTADTQSPVTATFVAASGGTVPGNANIVLDFRSQLPGRRDLTFQASASTGTAPTSGAPTSTAQLNLPSQLLIPVNTVTMSLLPLAPDDQQTPPYVTSLPLNFAGQLSYQLPSNNVSISGALNTSVAKVPTTTFVARAFQGSNLVSSSPLMSATDGSFRLTIPSAMTIGSSVTIQLTPQSQTDPWFIFTSIQLSGSPVSLGTVMLSPYTPVNQFNVLVQGNDESPVSGAVVTAQTTLGSSTSTNMYKGSTSFGRSGTADSNGMAVLSLLPGTTDVPVNYSLVAVPPVGSPWATTCSDPNSPAPAIGSGNVTTPGGQMLATLTLSPRPVLTGHVTDWYGGPVANVAITATPGSNPTGNCPSTPAAAANTTTDGGGAFMLPLDPGIYQLDYDPPAGSSAPRYTETGVNVAGTTPIQHNRTLQLGGLLSGTVTANQSLLPSATVKLFDTCTTNPSLSCSAPPVLLGQGVTDTNGHFQIVVPVNP